MSPGPWEPKPRMRKTLFDVLPEGGACERARARGETLVCARSSDRRTTTEEETDASFSTQWTRTTHRRYRPVDTRRLRAWDMVRARCR